MAHERNARRLAAAVVCLLLGTVFACKPAADDEQREPRGNPARKLGAVDRLTRMNALRQIGVAYVGFMDASQGRAPAKKEDLINQLKDVKSAVDLLERGDIVFYYGVRPVEMPEGSSATILAHDAADDDRGKRLVLFGNSAIGEMTAAEFARAPKAKR